MRTLGKYPTTAYKRKAAKRLGAICDLLPTV
jgi:hypothetical protein